MYTFSAYSRNCPLPAGIFSRDCTTLYQFTPEIDFNREENLVEIAERFMSYSRNRRQPGGKFSRDCIALCQFTPEIAVYLEENLVEIAQRFISLLKKSLSTWRKI